VSRSNGGKKANLGGVGGGGDEWKEKERFLLPERVSNHARVISRKRKEKKKEKKHIQGKR